MTKATPPPWTKDSAALVKQFFQSIPGELFLTHVAANRPNLLTGNPDPNAVALQAQEVAGYERALSFMLSLQDPPQQPPSDPGNYPPIDDEEAWEKEGKDQPQKKT